MKLMQQLAIVIPYYKITFFEATLQSLDNQTDKRFKVYIGDDASLESPAALLEKFKGKIEFSYHRFDTNLGNISLTKQWERCIALTQAEEWLMILGDDDVLGETVVASWYENYSIFNNKSNVVRFKSVLLNNDSIKISEYQINPKYEFAASSFIRKIRTQIRSSLSEYVFRTESIKRIGFKDYALGWHSDDKALIDFSEGLPIFSINNSFINIRVSQFSISGKKDNLKLKNEAKVNFYFDLIKDNLDLFTKSDKKLLLNNYEYLKKNYTKLQFKDAVFISSKYLINHFYFSFFLFHFRNLKMKIKMLSEFASLIFWKIKFHFFKSYNNNFNKVVREQVKDYKKIPIIIINYNNLTSLKRLIIFLKKRDLNYIIILDNNSTYKPLIEYYSKIENEIKIIKNKKNEGHRVFWKNKSIYNMFKKGYYVITDSDIEPDESCPEDFLTYFKKVLDANNAITKVGFSLKINDIPITNIHKNKITDWESKFWQIQNKDGDYVADIDTTFALYRPLNQFNIKYFYKAIRTNYPYIAKHWGWYISSNNLTEEQKFYMETANKSGSWRINKEGELKETHYE